MDEAAPEKKNYGLKPIEMQVIQAKQQLFNTDVSNFLSYIAVERLAYPVTPQTAFDVDFEKGTITMWEKPVEGGVDSTPEQTSDEPAAKPKKLR